MKNNLIIAIICYSIILFHITISWNIIMHPYMVGLMITTFGVGGYNLGLAISKIVNNIK